MGNAEVAFVVLVIVTVFCPASFGFDDSMLTKVQNNANEIVSLSAQFDQLSKARKRTVGEAQSSVDSSIGKVEEKLQPLINNFNVMLKDFKSHQTNMNPKLDDSITQLIEQTNSIANFKNTMKADFEKLGKDIHRAVDEINPKWAEEQFAKLHSEISKHNKYLDDVEGMSVEMKDNLGHISKRQSEEMAAEINQVASSLTEVQETLVKAAKLFDSQVVPIIDETQVVVDNMLQAFKGLYSETDRKISQILATTERQSFTAAYHDVWQRIRYLRKRRPATLDSNSVFVSKNDVNVYNWAISMTKGDRFGMSMAECLFNFHLMIMGRSRAFQLRSILGGYLETANAILERSGGASQRLLVEMAIREFQEVQSSGYSMLIEAYLVLDQKQEAKDAFNRLNEVTARQSVLFKSYIQQTNTIVETKSGSDGYLISNKLSPANITLSRKPILGCRFCKGCDGLVDSNLLMMQCKFAENMNISPGIKELPEWKDASIFPKTFVEVHKSCSGSSVNSNNGSTSSINFIDTQYKLVDAEHHYLCGIQLGQKDPRTRALFIDVDVCELRTNKWLGSSRQQSRLIQKTSCDGSSPAGAIATADRISLDWNQLSYRRGIVFSAGLCAFEKTVGRQHKPVRVLHITFRA